MNRNKVLLFLLGTIGIWGVIWLGYLAGTNLLGALGLMFKWSFASKFIAHDLGAGLQLFIGLFLIMAAIFVGWVDYRLIKWLRTNWQEMEHRKYKRRNYR